MGQYVGYGSNLIATFFAFSIADVFVLAYYIAVSSFMERSFFSLLGTTHVFTIIFLVTCGEPYSLPRTQNLILRCGIMLAADVFTFGLFAFFDVWPCVENQDKCSGIFWTSMKMYILIAQMILDGGRWYTMAAIREDIHRAKKHGQ
jgi:hypothetical protein